MQSPLSTARLGAALTFCAALAAPVAALANGAALSTEVTPLSSTVTYSTAGSADAPALHSYVGYTVRVTNVGGAAAGDVHFKAMARATDSDEAVIFDSAEGAACTPIADGSMADCALGALGPGQIAPAFFVFFRVPVKDALTPLPDGDASMCAKTDCVSASGIAYTGDGSAPVSAWSTAEVTLSKPNPAVVQTVVPKAGGTLFTGTGVSLDTDLFTTLVTVPASAQFATAAISESPDATGCTNNFSTCFRSDVTIPGSFSPYLTIVLRQDASTILKGTKIDSVLIEYTGAAGSVILGQCANATTPRSDGIPCIAKRVHYVGQKGHKGKGGPKDHKSARGRKDHSGGQTPGWTPDLDGDFEWTLINLGNGSYKVF
jgi:hypothetical protein